MNQATGLLSKVSDRNYSLLTMNGEILIQGDIPYSDGFYNDIDLSNVKITNIDANPIASFKLFSHAIGRDIKNQADCPNDCVGPDDCVTPNDCDCDCADCVAPN